MTNYGRIFVNDATVTVGTTKTNVLHPNPHRVGFVITNTHATATVSLARGNPPVANSGIVLLPKETYYESQSDGYPCWRGAVGGIGSAAATVAVSETIQTQG